MTHDQKLADAIIKACDDYLLHKYGLVEKLIEFIDSEKIIKDVNSKDYYWEHQHRK